MELKRKLYLWLAASLLKVISLFNARIKSGIVIIRLDAIGDYLLFRNFLYEFKKSTQFAKYKITLIGNQAWKDIAETFDGGVIDKFIWLDCSQMRKNKKYLSFKLIHLTSIRYEYLIVPTYSRDFIGDILAIGMPAKYKIASIGDLSNITKESKQITDKYYSKLVPAKTGVLFEFERNREFFQNLFAAKLDTKFYIKALITQFHNRFGTYVILFVGASTKNRQWSRTNFMALAQWLYTVYGVNVLVCGGVADLAYFDERTVAPYLHNLIGKTSLVEMVDLLSLAKFVVSNETSIPHMCIALDVPVFVIYNGDHYGRFTPYPQDLTHKYNVIYHPQIEQNMDNYLRISNKPGYTTNLNIDEITLEVVQYNILENLI